MRKIALLAALFLILIHNSVHARTKRITVAYSAISATAPLSAFFDTIVPRT